jgi:hypothetical protein
VWSGAAGVLWALHRLESDHAVELDRSYVDAAVALHADYLRRAGGETPAVPSLLVGEAGILLTAEVMAPGSGAERLLAAIRENERNETNELLWGAPGTMVAAGAMLDRTGDERWREAWEGSAKVLWERWQWDTELGCHLWTQDLYGSVRRFVGSGHGFAGNVCALSQLLEGERRREFTERVAATTCKLAEREDGLANWAPVAGEALRSARDGSIRVQWCHGAPGMVTSLAAVDGSPELDQVLLEAGELTWRAGPLEKGPGLCHGTAGNGLAFLALHRRTGDAEWLERARAFAMHAIDQVERMKADYGCGRFSLWTGDLGPALFAWQCISGDPSFPTIDVW